MDKNNDNDIYDDDDDGDDDGSVDDNDGDNHIVTDNIIDDNKNKNLLKTCGICLDELQADQMYSMTFCSCTFCIQCLDRYFQFMIDNGHFRIYCPSYKCLRKQSISIDEINDIITNEYYRQKIQTLFTKNKCLQINGDNNSAIINNNNQLQCPFCEQIFDNNNNNNDGDDINNNGLMKSLLIQLKIEETNVDNDTGNGNENGVEKQKKPILILKCPNCSKISCASCSSRLSDENSHHDCRDPDNSILNEFDIKRCPNCHYLIQREGGCAQISCRNCCHVFCWHCLQSLDNDFLLFHYDSGPCKNKLGHSRLSIFFNRAQTISICLGISILMLLASPVIIALLPCVLTKKCHLYNYCCCCCFGRQRRQRRRRQQHHRKNSSSSSSSSSTS
ncbi:putative E3 ubiquitin-protein ligase RNF144A-A isoform X2 [Dermatophagoides farinae]